MTARSEEQISRQLADAVRLIDVQIAGLETALRELHATRETTIQQIRELGSDSPSMRLGRTAYGAIKDDVLGLLSASPSGLPARHLIAELRTRGTGRNERSVRNALFRLKAAGQIVRDGRLYRIP